MNVARESIDADVLTARADTTPSATALIRTTDGRQWSYRDLDEAVDRTAGRLAGLGVGEDDRVGLLLGNRVEFLRVLYATFRLNGTVVPFNLELPPETLASQVERSDPDLLVCEEDTAATARRVTGEQPVVSVDRGSDHRSLGSLDRVSVDPPGTTADADRLLLYTSGTTGEPKGVRLTAGNLRASAIASAFRLGVDPADRWLSPLPAYHMGGLAPHLRSTTYGTTAVLQPSFDADRTRQALATYEVTCISLVPTAVKRLLDAGDLPSSLRFVLCGGAPTPASLVDRCARRDVPLCPTYGMTETASQVATALPDTARTHTGTVGQPLYRTTVTVVDEDGNPLPPGEEGELVVDGPTVTPGYDDPTGDEPFGEFGFHTGDLGYRDDAGRLWVTGRVDDLIVTGGENVNPATVREALESFPRIESAAVVGLDDPEWGERVAALLVPDSTETIVGDEDDRDDDTKTIVRGLTDDQLKEHLDDRIATYERPKTLAVAASLPRTSSGTVDRTAVEERIEAAGVAVDDE